MDDRLVDTIHGRLLYVRAQITNAAVSIGREADSVTLVVVTKAQPLEVVRAAILAGATCLGENYAEEGLEKITKLKAEFKVEWHMIGHIQSRKAALVADHYQMVHSLDSLKLANRLDRFSGEQGKRLPVLVEFNVSGEGSKYGWPAWDESRWPDLLPELNAVLALPHLHVRGAMTMPPYFEDPQESRPYFQRMRRLQVFLTGQLPHGQWHELSMGTSIDYHIAVQEGATLVRVGETILGPRPVQ
ncbi:MAG: YggS family pyridoxal phosphate-dependent enzyme [Chloroflexota bacterium]